MLKEEVYKKMIDLSDRKEDIIYEDYKVNKEINIEWYQVIVQTSSGSFRIYLGTLHSTGNIEVTYMSIYKDMLKAIYKHY